MIAPRGNRPAQRSRPRGDYAQFIKDDETMKVIDLTHVITPDMPVYPGTDTPKFIPANTYEKDGFKETLLQMYSHTGTHMDPPAHLFPGRTTLDQFPADQFIGKALVIDCRDLAEGEAITMDRLRKAGEKAERADFLLFNLGWDQQWGPDAYFGTIRVSTMRCWTTSSRETIRASAVT